MFLLDIRIPSISIKYITFGFHLSICFDEMSSFSTTNIQIATAAAAEAECSVVVSIL